MHHEQRKCRRHWFTQHGEKQTGLTLRLATEGRNFREEMVFQQALNKEDRGILLMAEEKDRGGCGHWGSENIKHQNLVSKFCDSLTAVVCVMKQGFLYPRLTSNFLCSQSWLWTSDPNRSVSHMLWLQGHTPMSSIPWLNIFWQFPCVEQACVEPTEICLLCAEMTGLDHSAWLHPMTQTGSIQWKVLWNLLVPEISGRKKKSIR